MDIRFDGKRALVTGAGKGIGWAIAVKLAECGANVVAISRTKADLDKLKEQIPSIETHTLDLSDWDATRTLVQSLGPIDLLVNNAGIIKVTPFLEVSKEEVDTQFDTNYKTAFNVSQIVAKGMVERGSIGAIVMVSSNCGIRAIPGFSVYCCTKGAMDQLCRCLAIELGPHKIRVNCVNPTVTKTKMAMVDVGLHDPVKTNQVLSRIPLGRLAEVEDVAKATLFLLSENASMINGITMSVDGGAYVRLNDIDIPKEKMVELFANSGDLDLTSRSAVSDLGLHCLPVTRVGCPV